MLRMGNCLGKDTDSKKGIVNEEENDTENGDHSPARAQGNPRKGKKRQNEKSPQPKSHTGKKVKTEEQEQEQAMTFGEEHPVDASDNNRHNIEEAVHHPHTSSRPLPEQEIWSTDMERRQVNSYPQMQNLSLTDTAIELYNQQVLHQQTQQVVRDVEKEEMREKIKHLEAENARLTTRFGEDMNRCLAGDETALENINKKNRPTKIVDEYMSLLSNQWLGAKEELDRMYPKYQEELKLNFLSDILKEAEALAKQEIRIYKGFVQHVLQNPFIMTEDFTPKTLRDKLTQSDQYFDGGLLGEELKDLLCTYIKDKSDTANAQMLSKVLIKKMQTLWTQFKEVFPSNIQKKDGSVDYAVSACALCWKMVVQRPPMSFDFDETGVPPTKERHDLYYSCSSDKSAVISTYVSPALLHNEKLLVKGKVFTVTRAEWEQRKKLIATRDMQWNSSKEGENPGDGSPTTSHQDDTKYITQL